MPVHYSTIKSFVVDIETDTPKKSDSFLVDTNVWYWITYTKASGCPNPPMLYQTNYYPKYIKSALTAGSNLFRYGLSLSELSHSIEKSERELCEKKCGVKINPKEFRHNMTPERIATVNEIEISWNQVKSMSNLRDITIDEQTCCDAMELIKGACIDGYDAFQSIEERRIDPNFKIITDDGDFSSIPDIWVFTKNRSIINEAKHLGRLIVR